MDNLDLDLVWECFVDESFLRGGGRCCLGR